MTENVIKNKCVIVFKKCLNLIKISFKFFVYQYSEKKENVVLIQETGRFLKKNLEFSERFIRSVMQGKQPSLREQLVWLVIDNVTGKHYKRQPRWLWVEEVINKKDPTRIMHKILHCEKIPKFDRAMKLNTKENN